ncbi:MAG TPA: hypothetical protein IAA98_09850 [Candidatus Avipropionibacterium avicola]|uniref:Uncharacterized protein n=1 Tax=Candidatus Avipropionibacterium avicola TaxID=2840701 RepID=A0A9D1GY09_9ACTN|nr:hypothetical protein [Candidatus Avipropionibacterium avicola]
MTVSTLLQPKPETVADLDGHDRVLPAWPVLAVLWGYPLWWAAGLLPFAQVAMAVPMVGFLILRRRVVLTPGILPWLGFVAWMVPSALMIDGFGRLVGHGVRFSQFLALAIMMVYVVNARTTLTPRRVLDGLSFTWVFIIVGGYLGMLFPDTRLTWTIGRLLPGALAEHEYVRELVFPTMAEIQAPWGAEEPFVRPSAPFAYSNGWGAAMAILTPIVVANVTARGTRTSRCLLVLGLVAAVPPTVASTNRGLLVGIAVAVAWVALRLLLRGRWGASLAAVTFGGLGTAGLLASGFLDGVTERQDTVDTTQGRADLYVETFQRTLASPVLGYGAPRPSFTSEIWVGTQGAIWNAMFCFGFVGLALFVAALASAVLRTWDAPTTSTLWLQASAVVACVLSIFYGLDRHLVFLGIAVAMVLREKYLPSSDYWNDQAPPLGRRRDHG